VAPQLNEQTSTEAGRAANPEDGGRRWKARAYFTCDACNFTVRCDHVSHVIEHDDVAADLAAGRSEVTVHRHR
jgi:hypothetical protein